VQPCCWSEHCQMLTVKREATQRPTTTTESLAELHGGGAKRKKSQKRKEERMKSDPVILLSSLFLSFGTGRGFGEAKS